MFNCNKNHISLFLQVANDPFKNNLSLTKNRSKIMKIGLSAETTIDLPVELLEKYNIKTAPFTILLGDETVLDEQGISARIFDYVSKTKVLPKTSAVNREQFKEHFASLLKEYDAIVHISLSSEMSSACENARAVAEEIGKDKVAVIDSRSLSTGIALLAIYARKLIDKGESLSEIEKKLNERTSSVQASFFINTLDYLYKGGRCNSLQLFGANILKIKPEILVKDGKMVTGKKFFGLFGNVTNSYFNDIFQKFDNPDKEVVFITYSTAEQKTVDLLYGKLQEKGFKNIYVTQAGGTICSHCGPGTLGILFINDGGKE